MKKTQIWYLDFILGLSIFFLILIFVFNFILQQNNQNDDKLKKEAEKISNYLVSEGLPKNWTIENVSIIGLAKENEIDINKLEMFGNLSINYTYVKGLFGIENDFVVFFEDNSDNIINFTSFNFTYFGYPNITKHDVFNFSENTYTLVRYLIYRHSIAEIIQMKIIMFQK